ncbi:hypothetical protein [Haloarcula onubensis]|uniref:MarR family transcriptional regulator n=1 Tax=Haloarcula onubensis TaxID=2950539 RepID=A0ABU2FL63_9EURY|nr:hypothetical protein [Halomicroarcula sp. S3CR25-11]MDS0280987.1 hypothetical protein [Halomicroarcula sp. S3CR25-11]
MSDGTDSSDDVTVSMELSGPYDDVLEKLQPAEAGRDSLVPVVADLEVLLETVVGIDGGTRSVIAEALPADTAAEFDPGAVVDALQVLERYDLVVLDGNTWRPGPRLDE